MATDYVHRPIDILELQIAASTVQNEAFMRYVTNPSNLIPIREILKRALDDLAKIEVDEPQVMCPDGWVHLSCRCIVPTLQNQCYNPAHSG